jgi:hypothetical protein
MLRGLCYSRALIPFAAMTLGALRKLQREAPKSRFVFLGEHGGPFTKDSFNWMIKQVGQKTSIPFQVHAHAAQGRKL